MRKMVYSKDHLTFFAHYKTPEEHRHFAKHLIFGVGDQIECSVKGSRFTCGGICIGSDVLHTVAAQGTNILIMLIDETSELSCYLEKTYLRGRGYCILDEIIAAQVSDLCRKQTDMERLDTGVLSICSPQTVGPAVSDERILDVLQAIKESESIDKGTLSGLCDIACLSKSRLSHLFRQQVKTPLKSYLVIAKMEKTYRYVIQGENLTTAAIHAGFNSSSHFSVTCKKLFGISFSDFLRQ